LLALVDSASRPPVPARAGVERCLVFAEDATRPETDLRLVLDRPVVFLEPEVVLARDRDWRLLLEPALDVARDLDLAFVLDFDLEVDLDWSRAADVALLRVLGVTDLPDDVTRRRFDDVIVDRDVVDEL